MAGGLVVRDAVVRFGDLVVLNKFDLTLQRGASLIVTGPNGAGKSTLLQVCAGLLPPSSGTVLLDGLRPDASRPSSLFRQGVRRGFVFENGGLIANQTALGNVTLPLRYHADLLGLDSAAIDARARASLQKLGVTQADYHTLPAHLSLGLRKRVSVARLLALEPNFVFFDEPLTGLDAATRRLLHALLEGFRDDPKVTMMITMGNVRPLQKLGLPVWELVNTFLLDRFVSAEMNSPPSSQTERS
jgi:ABC-type transporter Mla maintaining outer membrane lipid asymmetry ATPase subunit MlaF